MAATHSPRHNATGEHREVSDLCRTVDAHRGQRQRREFLPFRRAALYGGSKGSRKQHAGKGQRAGKGQVLYGGLTLSVEKLDIASTANLQSGTERRRT